jgi:hypothetical protein
MNLARCAALYGCAIGAEQDVWVEHREKRVEVTGARGSEEGVDKFALAGEIGVGHRRRSPHPAACAARELPCRGRGAAHDGSDLVEGNGERIVQHEREALGGIQGAEYHEQGQANRVGQERFLLGVAPVLRADGHVRPQGLLAPRVA